MKDVTTVALKEQGKAWKDRIEKDLMCDTEYQGFVVFEGTHLKETVREYYNFAKDMGMVGVNVFWVEDYNVHGNNAAMLFQHKEDQVLFNLKYQDEIKGSFILEEL